MKERILAIFLLFLAAVTIWAVVTELPQKNYATPASTTADFNQDDELRTSSVPTVADEVIRLHILADSDSESDQAIKLAVRDILLPYLNAATLGAANKEEALQQLEKQCGTLTEVANAALSALGADYTATVSVETLYFPIRIYGSQTYLSEDAVIFPPGFYDSIQVVLGSGKGHNWWCLAYPSLCFIDATYDYIPKESGIYKIKLGSLEQPELLQLFYGGQADALFSKIDLINKLPEEIDGGVPPEETSFQNTDSFSPETTIYIGSKLWELLKHVFSGNLTS